MSRLEDTLNQIYALQKTNKSYQHGIRENKCEIDNGWKEFEPTNFIYAFFVFNYIYNYDWKLTFIKNEVEEHNEDASQFSRISTLIEYLFSVNEKDSLKKYLNILKYNLPCEPIKASNILKNIKGNPDNADQFFYAFKEILIDHNYNNCFAKLHYIYKFIYKVRCNVFHGSKREIQMREPNQKMRLEIYTALLLSLNDLFIIIASTESRSWRKGLAERYLKT